MKVASYNIHKCRGVDGATRPDRIIGVIRELGADVIALQEVDRRFGRRAGLLDPSAICHFAPEATRLRFRPFEPGVHRRHHRHLPHLAGPIRPEHVETGGQRFERSGEDLGADGLYVALEPWAFHFLAFSAAPAETEAPLVGAESPA